MKRILLFLYCAMACCLGASAQEKYFNEAIRQGRTLKSFYQIKNEKQKMIKLDDLTKYAKQKGYIMGKYTRKEMGRFGDVAITIKTFDFIPKSEFPQYICENTTGLATSAFKNKGTAYFYQPSGSEYFCRYDDVMWTGEVKNGKIHGQGTGFKQVDATNYICFTGTFNEGVLQGEGQFSTYAQSSEKSYYVGDWQKRSTAKTGQMSDGLAWILVGDKYGYIDTQGHTVIKPAYRVAKNFSNGIAYVTEDKTEMKINKSGTVVGVSEYAVMSFDEMVNMKNKYPQLAQSVQERASKYVEEDISFDELVRVEQEFPALSSKTNQRKTAIYQKDSQQLQAIYQSTLAAASGNQLDLSGESTVNSFITQYSNKHKFDPDNKVPMARELANYYAVCAAYKLGLHSQYWGYHGDEPYYSGDASNHRSILSRAQQICNSGGASAFKSFYAFAKPSIDSKYNQLSSTLSRDRHAYDMAYSEYQAELRRKEAERRACQEEMERILKSVSTSNIYAFVVKMDNDWSKGRVFDSDENHEDYKDITFKDIDCTRPYSDEFYGRISEVTQNGRRLYYKGGGNRYTTETDAIVAEFLSNYHKRWSHNEYSGW